MKTYTIEQIRNYIGSQDSLGDVLYNLSETSLDKANIEINLEDIILEEISENTWDAHYCPNGKMIDAEIGYLTIIDGVFSVTSTITGEEVFSANGNGIFESDECNYYFDQAKEALLKSYLQNK